MTIIRRHTYTSEGKITATWQDGDYLFLAIKNTSSCTIKKVSIFDPTLIYFSFTVSVDEITRLKVSGNYLYASFDDSTYIAGRYSKTNPAGSYTLISKPVAVTEKGIDLCIGSTDWYVLIPGEDSGNNAQVVVITGTTVSETVDLDSSGDVITNARSCTVDGSDNVFIVTYEASPAQLIRFYDDGGYTYTVWDIEE